MKNNALLGILIFLSFTICNANLAVGLDVKAGINLASMSGSNIDDYIKEEGQDKETFKGLAIGLAIPFTFSEIFTVQPELLFMQKGLTLVEENYSDEQELTSLDIPILFKVNFLNNRMISPNIYTGPYFSFHTSSEVGGNGDLVDYEVNTEVFDFGLSFGAGLKIDAGMGHIITDVRYSKGFLPVYKTNEELNHSVFTLMAGYGFEF